MRWLLCFIFPPLAVLLCGRPTVAILNVFLCIVFWVPGVIHALLVVSEHKADRRAARMAGAMAGLMKK